MKLKKEYSIALMVIGGAALLWFGYSYLRGRDLFQKENVYHGVFNNASGVTTASPLTLNGFKVGQVLKAKLLFDGTRMWGKMSARSEATRTSRKSPYAAGAATRRTRLP